MNVLEIILLIVFSYPLLTILYSDYVRRQPESNGDVFRVLSNIANSMPDEPPCTLVYKESVMPEVVFKQEIL